jgi:FkbM family methyltransferase
MLRQLYSQAGQDLWVIRDVFGYMQGGYFIDIGAADGVELSNSLALEKYHGWSGLCIEPSPAAFAELRVNRKCECLNLCIDAQRQEVEFTAEKGFFGGIIAADTNNVGTGHTANRITTHTFKDVIQEHRIPETIHYLSVDVEGAEHRVMATFPFHTHRFLAATIERPGTELRSVLAANGYVLVAEIPYLDAFYLHSSILQSYNVRAKISGGHRALPLPSRLLSNLRWLFENGLRSAFRRL